MPKVRRLLAGLLFLTPLAGAADPALLDFIMPDARVVVGIDVAHIRSSPLNASFSSVTCLRHHAVVERRVGFGLRQEHQRRAQHRQR